MASEGSESKAKLSDKHEPGRKKIEKNVMNKLKKQQDLDIDSPLFTNMGSRGTGTLLYADFKSIAWHRNLLIRETLRTADENKCSPHELRTMLDKTNEEFLSFAEGRLKSTASKKHRIWEKDDMEYERNHWRVKQACDEMLETYRKTKHLYT